MTPEDLFLLFEGACPECHLTIAGDGKYVPVHITKWGGTAEFLEQQSFSGPDVPTPDHWSSGGDEIGCVEFKCENGHEFYVGYSPVSSWIC